MDDDEIYRKEENGLCDYACVCVERLWAVGCRGGWNAKWMYVERSGPVEDIDLIG